MKRIIFIALIAVVLTGVAGAGGLDMHFGLGYNAQYFGDYSSLNTDFAGDAAWMPYGIGAYAGVGYGFGAKKVFNIGFEPAISMGVNFQSDLAIANIVLQGRAYMKLRPANAFTIAAYGGFSYDVYGGTVGGQDFSLTELAPVVGGRITLLFLYAQYDVTFYEDPYPMRHSFGVGFAFKK
jgi:hypothetical protein